MWTVEVGVDVAENTATYMLVNTDTAGKELRKAGQFASQENAAKMADIMNSGDTHKANVIAGLLDIIDTLDALAKA
jgi:hypothetical protein